MCILVITKSHHSTSITLFRQILCRSTLQSYHFVANFYNKFFSHDKPFDRIFSSVKIVQGTLGQTPPIAAILRVHPINFNIPFFSSRSGFLGDRLSRIVPTSYPSRSFQSRFEFVRLSRNRIDDEVVARRK